MLQPDIQGRYRIEAVSLFGIQKPGLVPAGESYEQNY